MAVQLSIPRMHLQARPTVWMPAVAIALFVAAYFPLVARQVHLTLPSAPASIVAQAPTNSTPAPKSPVAQAAGFSNPATTCSPIGFPSPNNLELSVKPVGLSVQQDSPTTYQIFGNSADELRTQIQHCAPGAHGSASAEFTAETSYRMNWQYDVSMSGAGCTLTNVRVGVHTATVLPYWQPGRTATNGLSERWQNFMTALSTHEQGHATLDQQYAGTLLSDLQAVQNVDCGTLNSLVNAVITQDVNALNTANDNYDTTTDHGATQGAVLPTN